jgi:hypothetical protein
MLFRRSLLAAAAAAVMTAATLALPALPASASSPLGTTNICDQQSTPLCLSANGTIGNWVYGKTYANDHEQATTVAAANVCGGTDVVDGNHTNCPFVVGSGYNNQFRNDVIVQIYNAQEGPVWYTSGISTGMRQAGGADSGYLWVLSPAADGNYVLVNVLDTNANPFQAQACAQSANQPITVQDTWSGGGACTWTLP